jgi:hypothetical protein
MDSAPSRRRARLVLLPDSLPSVASELPSPSDVPGDGDEDPPGPDPSQRLKALSAAAPLRPQRPSSSDAATATMNPVALTERFPESSPAPSEDLGQGLGQGLGWLGGVSIALLTLLVPITSVVLDRQDQSTGYLLPRLSERDQRHGSHNPSGKSSAWVGESPGGDTGRQPQ